MNKYFITYIVVVAASFLASIFFIIFAPNFEYKNIISGVILFVPIGVYTIYFDSLKKKRERLNKDRIDSFVGRIDHTRLSNFESVVLDFGKNNFKENFPYLEIYDSYFYSENDKYYLVIRGHYKLQVEKNKTKIDIMFDNDYIYVDIISKKKAIKLDFEYPIKSPYKMIEKEIFKNINSL